MTVIRLDDERYATPRLGDATCQAVGCDRPRDTATLCVACLEDRCDALLRERVMLRQHLGFIVARARRLVDVLGAEADGPLYEPDVGRPWLSTLRVAHAQLEVAVYPERTRT